MTSLQDYIEIFEKRSTVYKLVNTTTFDWMNEAQKNFKPPSAYHFGLMKSKRILLKRNPQLGVVVKSEEAYESTERSFQSLFKKGKSIKHFSPSLITRNTIELDSDKIKDLNTLLTLHFGEEWKEDEQNLYFKYLLEGNLI